jgi:hypothetical protein
MNSQLCAHCRYTACNTNITTITYLTTFTEDCILTVKHNFYVFYFVPGALHVSTQIGHLQVLIIYYIKKLIIT